MALYISDTRILPIRKEDGGDQNGPQRPFAPEEGPVPMSLPEILRNPRIQHLQASTRTNANGLIVPVPRKSDPHIGKRRQRRKENSRFLSNPHAVRPSPADYQIPANTVRSTFAVEHSAPDHNKALEELAQINYSHAPDFASPKHNRAAFEVDSAIQGQFSISLRDAHHFLRARLDEQYQVQHVANAMYEMSLSSTPSPVVGMEHQTFIQELILTACREIQNWIQQTVHVQVERGGRRSIIARPNAPATDAPAIDELRRSPAQLVWHVGDAYNRLAVHCVARVLNCPSFSYTAPSPLRQSDATDRHTWILHPNPLLRGSRNRRAITRRPVHQRTSSASTTGSATSSVAGIQDAVPPPLTAGILHYITQSLDTPPVTDYELSDSVDDTDLSDFVSGSEL